MDAQETRIYTAIIITSVVIGCIIIYFVVSIIRQQRRNLELYKKNILAEITGLENDRARIASDLHDELGPMLSAVKMKINSFDLTDPDDKVQITKTNEHIDSILKRIREISYDLMPTSLTRKGLVPALKEFADYVNNANSIKIFFNSTGELPLNESQSINLYRVVQEIIHNTIRHAGATELHISLAKENNKVILSTKDNGVGFEKNEVQTSQGLGLRNLLSRTQLMNGQMFLETRKKFGTEYTFEIPLYL